jgi:hypothetical protein
MGKGPCAFKEADIARAYRAAKKAGVEVQITVDLEHKTMTLTPISTSNVKNGTVTAKNDWDSIYDQN